MTDIPANLIYSPDELDRWLDETSTPLSDDEMEEMSAYFQLPDNGFFDIIKS